MGCNSSRELSLARVLTEIHIMANINLHTTVLSQIESKSRQIGVVYLLKNSSVIRKKDNRGALLQNINRIKWGALFGFLLTALSIWNTAHYSATQYFWLLVGYDLNFSEYPNPHIAPWLASAVSFGDRRDVACEICSRDHFHLFSTLQASLRCKNFQYVHSHSQASKVL